MTAIFRLLALAGLLWAAGAPPATAQDIDKAGIRAVIEQQLAAFQRDDGVAAFGFAAPNIRAIFTTPERFMAMVRQGYPAVYRAAGAEFLEPRQAEGQLFQPVRVTGPDGKTVVALYTMQRQSDGSWRISGCVLLDDSGASA